MRRVLLAVAALGAATTLSACTAPRPGAAATVGSGRVTVDDLVNRVDAVAADPASQGKSRADLQRLVLSELISDRVDDDLGRRLGQSVSDAEIDASISQNAASSQTTSDAALESKLLAQQAGYAGLRTFVRDFLLQQKLRRSFASTVPLSEANLQQLYASNSGQFNTSDISVIVVKDFATAQSVYAQVRRNPAGFAALAATASLDPSGKSAGGEQGVHPKGYYSPAIETLVYKAQPGYVLGPVAITGGFAVLKVNALTETSFADARPRLEALAKDPQGQLAVAAVGQRRREDADRLGVWVNPRFGNWSGSAALTNQGAALSAVTPTPDLLSTTAGSTSP